MIDTAPSYGDGESERTLGRLLGSFDRAPYVATKARLDAAALADPAGEIERSLAGSLERLRRDSVDVLQLHNPIAAESDSRHVAADRVLGDVADAFDGLRAQGLVRFIGVTGLGEAAAVRRVVASGRFDTAQVYCNMLNPSAGRTMLAAWEGHDFSGVLDACRAADVGVMNIRVFAAGVLAGDRRHGREVPVVEDSALDREERRAAAVFAALGGGYGTRAQTALRFALAEGADLHGRRRHGGPRPPGTGAGRRRGGAASRPGAGPNRRGPCRQFRPRLTGGGANRPPPPRADSPPGRERCANPEAQGH